MRVPGESFWVPDPARSTACTIMQANSGTGRWAAVDTHVQQPKIEPAPAHGPAAPGTAARLLARMTGWRDMAAPDVADLEEMARSVVEALPENFRAGAKEVALRVEEFASDEMLESLGMDDPLELTGLYDGIPLTERSVADQPERPDAIWLFRRAIIEEWVERGNVTLLELVTNVMVHELAHHFGWSDDDIASVDEWWT